MVGTTFPRGPTWTKGWHTGLHEPGAPAPLAHAATKGETLGRPLNLGEDLGGKFSPPLEPPAKLGGGKSGAPPPPAPI
jgi:hypothetical protein